MSYGLAQWEAEQAAADHRRALTRLRVNNWRVKHGGTKQTQQFLGVDGEGAGKDEQGRQNFLLLRAGGRELFNDNRRLTTEQCFEFLLGIPRAVIPIGYFFTYDATQILRDLPPERLQMLFTSKERGEGKSPYTYWGEYAIDFRPKQYFRVARLKNRNSFQIIPNSSRTVNEVAGFFQGPFVKQLIDWEVCNADDLAKIAAGKEDRGNEDRHIVTDIEREYCALEVHYLESLMEKFREVCIDTGTVPINWRGSGAIAAALHSRFKTPKQKGRKRARNLEYLAQESYFGGRFEVTQIGRIPGPVYEYDINSAYPAGMLECPCPFHTRWHRFDHTWQNIPFDRLPETYVARIVFDHPLHPPLCGLPLRRKGRLYWPERGEGSYWSPEIRAAHANGMQIVSWGDGYWAEKRCDCVPFDWVRELYDYRLQIGKSTRGIPLKLGINSLYGKLCQRIGAAPWRDLIAGGLITAHCRAKLADAYRQFPDQIIMLATDALFSRVRLPVKLGSDLGQWEGVERPTGLFVVQPGVYWSPDSDKKPKTRGIPQAKVIEHRHDFEKLWDRWASGDGPDTAPALRIKLNTFIGHRLALHRNKPELAGSWRQITKNISFDWVNKRERSGQARGGLVYTFPKRGSFDEPSEPYDPAALSELMEQIMMTEAADDFVPLGNTDE